MTGDQAEKVSVRPAPSEPDAVPDSSNGTLSLVALNTPLIENDVGDVAGERSAEAAAGAAVAKPAIRISTGPSAVVNTNEASRR